MRTLVPLTALATMICLSANAGSHLPGRCQGLDPGQDGDADRAFECIADLESKLDEIMTVFANIDHRHPPEIPSGAVMAFDLSGGCPANWSPFRAAQSRTIVGASFGQGSEPGLSRNEDGQDLIEYKYRDHGGVEVVALEIGHMPKHKHELPRASGTTINDTSANNVLAFTALGQAVRLETDQSPAGETKPHNNMPPYIALYFCKKD